MNDATVRQVIRKIENGTLPRDRIGAVSATYGAGQACDACSARVTPERILYKLARVGSPGFLFHSDCFAIWRDERNRMARAPARTSRKEIWRSPWTIVYVDPRGRSTRDVLANVLVDSDTYAPIALRAV